LEQTERDSVVRLIINGDDFGLCAGVNRGIVHLFEQGALTSATIMVNQPGTEEAVEFASQTPSLGLGVHLNLTTGRPLLPPDRVPTLVDEDGYFFSPSRLVGRTIIGRTEERDTRQELEAQIEFCYREGLQLTHLDTHSLTHAIPTLGSTVLQLARRYDIRAVRSPRVSAAIVPYAHRSAQRIRHRLGLPGARRQVKPQSTRFKGSTVMWRGLRTTHDLLYLRWWLGDNFYEDLEWTFSALENRTIEIMSHPGFADDELAARSTYVAGREEEVRVLSSQRFSDLLGRLDIVLTDYGGL
jgi:predicted glycoside hydrolase/deacetylase ChbG (UPF0249 family)